MFAPVIELWVLLVRLPFLFFYFFKLKESQVAKQSVKTELVEMEQRYLEKVGQWENSQEAFDQLTDELQSFQNLLRESQQKMEEQKRLIGSLQDQVDILKQQVRTKYAYAEGLVSCYRCRCLSVCTSNEQS